MHTMYQDNLYGDAARGCHHRGDGPDARQLPISHNRQRRERLVSKASRRTRGVAEVVRARHDADRVSAKKPDDQTNEPIGSSSPEKEVNNHGCKEEGREEAGCQEEGR
jgi:hypothetical protein